jgi:hypothetical protein
MTFYPSTNLYHAGSFYMGRKSNNFNPVIGTKIAWGNIPKKQKNKWDKKL